MSHRDRPVTHIRALILDPAHRVLGDASGAVVLDVAPTTQPLAVLEAVLRDRHAMAVPGPIGSRPGADPGSLELVFLVEPAASAPPGLAWRRLAEVVTTSAAAAWAWELYVDRVLAGYRPATRELDVFAFGADGAMASRLAHLVVAGDKRATALWLEAARVDGSTIPAPGLVSIIVDGFGVPRAAIRTRATEVARFVDVSAETAAAEGEGDRTLDDWRDGHREYFGAEAARLGLRFDDDATILIEHFEVLAIIGAAR